MPARRAISVSEQIRRIPSAVRPIVRAARRTVRAIAPTAKEVAYQSQPPRSNRTMWKLARYAVDDEYVVGIGTFADHSALFFYRGGELDDPGGLLQGSGKDLRFITLRARADPARPAVKRVVGQAFTLARSG